MIIKTSPSKQTAPLERPSCLISNLTPLLPFRRKFATSIIYGSKKTSPFRLLISSKILTETAPRTPTIPMMIMTDFPTIQKSLMDRIHEMPTPPPIPRRPNSTPPLHSKSPKTNPWVRLSGNSQQPTQMLTPLSPSHLSKVLMIIKTSPSKQTAPLERPPCLISNLIPLLPFRRKFATSIIYGSRKASPYRLPISSKILTETELKTPKTPMTTMMAFPTQ